MQELIDAFDLVHKDEMFNNEGWRKGFAGPRHRWAETGQRPNDYRTGDNGTLYHEYSDGTAHFMAFEVKEGYVLLMDSAGTTGRFAPSSDELELYNDQFPQHNVRYVYPVDGPQKVRPDTLCQTWSLAWLMRHEFPEFVVLLESAAHPKTKRPYLEMTEILDTFRNILSRPPYTRNHMARRWLEAYSGVRFHLEEYFWYDVPTYVTLPRAAAMRRLRGF